MKLTKVKLQIVAIWAIMTVVYLVVIFALPFKRNGLFWLSFLFTLVAVAAQLYILKIAFDKDTTVKSKFYGFPIARLGVMYLGAQSVVSLLFMIIASFAHIPMWIPVIVYVVLLGTAAIGMIAADVMRDEIERQDVKLKTDVSCMTALRSVVYALPNRCTDTAAKSALTDLAEEFRYSDPVSSEALKTIETELEEQIAQLQAAVESGNTAAITAKCNAVCGVLAERNRLCKLNK